MATTSTIFSDIGDYVIHSTDLFSGTTIVTTYMQQLKPVAVSVLIMFMLWKVSEVMIGSTKKPVADIMMELIVWSIVFSIAFNAGGWLDMTQNAMKGAYTWVGGGHGFFSDLDKWWDILSSISSDVFKKDTTPLVKVKGLLCIAIVSTAMVVLTLPTLMIYNEPQKSNHLNQLSYSK